MIQLQNQVSLLFKRIEDNTDKVIDFWQELLNENINGQKLERTGVSIAKQHQEIKSIVESIFKENSNHLQTLVLYGNYLEEVMNEHEESVRLLNKAKSISASVQTS